MTSRRSQPSSGVTQAFQWDEADKEGERGGRWNSFRHPQPGQRTVHPKAKSLPVDENSTFGKPPPEACAAYTDHVGALMHSDLSMKSGFFAVIQEQQERTYRSRRTEPLGKGREMQTELPASHRASNPVFPGFGIPSDKSVNAKVVMYPTSVTAADEAELERTRLQSLRKPRGVDFGQAGIDRETFTFGYVPPHEQDGVQACLQASVRAPQTKLMPKAVYEQRKWKCSDTLGEFSLGRAKPHVYSDPMTSMGPVQPTASELRAKRHECDAKHVMYQPVGDEVPSPRERIKQRLRTPADPNRTFGVPTIRNDIVPPHRRRTEDNTNYGDEVGARTLIGDGTTVEIKNAMVDKALTRDELIALLRRCGAAYDDIIPLSTVDEANAADAGRRERLFDTLWATALQVTSQPLSTTLAHRPVVSARGQHAPPPPAAQPEVARPRRPISAGAPVPRVTLVAFQRACEMHDV